MAEKTVWVIHVRNGQTKQVKSSYANKNLLNTETWVEGEEVNGKVIPKKKSKAKTIAK